MTEIEQVEDIKQEEKQEPKNLEDILKRYVPSSLHSSSLPRYIDSLNASLTRS